jgi:hypothetical protein
MALHLAHQRCNLREIGTGAYNVDDFQSASHEIVESVRDRIIASESGPFAARK